jgi:cytochrome c-type biogenesis protein
MGMLADLVQRGLGAWWAPALAFAAGVVSFASPCVYPLVPGYLAFVSGGQEERERRPIVPILLFILGFSVIFTALGASTWALQHIRTTLGERIAGSVIVAFGLFMLLYAFRIGWAGLYREARPFMTRLRPGGATAFPLGMAFAAGWTPCLGPVLGGITSIAAAEGGSARGAFLLFAYSLGLGVPFLLIGLGIRRVMRALELVKRNYRWIAGVSGVVMIAIGGLLIAGEWSRLLNPFLRWGNRISLPI